MASAICTCAQDAGYGRQSSILEVEASCPRTEEIISRPPCCPLLEIVSPSPCDSDSCDIRRRKSKANEVQTKGEENQGWYSSEDGSWSENGDYSSSPESYMSSGSEIHSESQTDDFLPDEIELVSPDTEEKPESESGEKSCSRWQSRARREEFRLYLENSGLMEAITSAVQEVYLNRRNVTDPHHAFLKNLSNAVPEYFEMNLLIKEKDELTRKLVEIREKKKQLKILCEEKGLKIGSDEWNSAFFGISCLKMSLVSQEETWFEGDEDEDKNEIENSSYLSRYADSQSEEEHETEILELK